MFLVVAMCALFNVFTAPYFVQNSGVLAALVFVWLAQATCLVALTLLLTTDPGIVPKSLYYRDQFDPVKGSFRDRPPPAAFENPIKTFPIRSKYCETCGTVRAPRVVHCSADDVDMERFDHHCPWIGCCVAKRNYKIFLVFLLSLSLACVGLIAVSVAHLALYTLDDYSKSNDLSKSVRTSLAGNIPVAIVAGVCVIFMWFIVGLTAYHMYLASNAMTTYEHIRGAFESIGNPYDKGRWYLNLSAIFTERTRPSWVDLRTKKTRAVLKVDSEIELTPDRALGSTASNVMSASFAKSSGRHTFEYSPPTLQEEQPS
jgi:lysylphosphatidylglycerol synthetase-like protein (DUF2156 family)